MKGDNRKLRAINDGTLYDVPAKMMRLAREIRNGDNGAVSSAIVILRQKDENGNSKTQGYWYGIDDAQTIFMMIEQIKRDVLG